MKKQHKTYAEVAGDFVGKPFNPSGYGQEGVEGFNCYGFCRTFLKSMGKEWVSEYHGKKMMELVADFNSDPAHFLEKETNVLVAVFDLVGREIPIPLAVAGDLVLIKMNTGRMYAAIYAGNNQIMSSFKPFGVKVIPCQKDHQIIRVRRVD